MSTYFVDRSRLERAMAHKGVSSLRELGRKSGVSWKTLMDYVSGKRSPIASRWEDIADTLGVDPLALLSADSGGKRIDMSSLKTLEQLLRDHLQDEPEVACVLFGSRAKGTAKEFSDWDIGFTIGAKGPLRHEHFVELRVKLDDALDDFPYVVELVNLDEAPGWFFDSLSVEDLIFVCGNSSAYSFFRGVVHGFRKEKVGRKTA